MRDWLIERRVFPQSMILSPNGILVQNYEVNPSDARTGVWANTAAFTVDPERLVTVNLGGIALRRTEVASAATYKSIRVGPGIPTAPLNPTPTNRNPFPGWAAQVFLTWPNAPPIFSESNTTGFVMRGADFQYSNNTQVIRGCFDIRSRVLTENGYLRIKDISDIPHRVLTEHGPKQAQGIVFRGKKPYLRVRTALGGDMRVTSDHRFRVMRPDGTLGWKAAQDLTEKDWLLGQRGHGGMLPEDRGGSVKRWYAIGHLYGDGHQITDGRLTWQVTESEPELVRVLGDFFQSEGLAYHTNLRPPFTLADGTPDCSETQTYMSSEKNDRHRFPEIPEYQSKGSWRRFGLPEATWTLGEKQLAALLRGLFTTDGGVNENGVIYYHTKWRSVAKDVRRALLLLGIMSKIHPQITRKGKYGPGRAYCVHILGVKSRFRFAERVGFALSRKQDRLEQYLKSQVRQQGCKSLFVPHATMLLNILFPSKYLYKTRDKSEDSVSSRIRVIRSGKADQLAETMVHRVIQRATDLGVESQVLQLLKLYIASDWYFDRVERVDPGYGEIEVADVFESETGTYVCEGIINKNCTGSVNPAAIIQGTMSVEGTVRLWRDGPIPDPYGDPNNPYSAATSRLTFTYGQVNPLQFQINYVLLTSDEFTIQGQNTPVDRTFGFAGLGDGTAPPFMMSIAS